ncbi:MAG: ankyrin repeat domain-containing protein [Candidatus Wallbacteria bacterium]|nr:ankyrin repeat domain-containing protein [Candidatus Wallbacteria bacterium]
MIKCLKKIILLAFLIQSVVLQASPDDTRLFAAINEENFTEVKHLISLGADPEAVDNLNNGYTPLIMAARRGNKDIVEYLLGDKVEVEVGTKDKKGLSPLMHAIVCKQTKIVNMLLEKKAKINDSDASQITPLMHAIYVGQVDLAKMLIEKGADVNAKDKNGTTALTYAVAQQNVSAVQLLLDKGAYKYSLDNFGNDPMKIATQLKNDTIINLLNQKKETITQKADYVNFYKIKE